MTDLEIDGPNPWTSLSSEVVWEDPYWRIRHDQVIQPDGERSLYSYLEPSSEFVVVVPLSANGTTFLVRQWRYPWQRNSWETPAGTCDAGETPLETAKRELVEETGMSAASWTELGTAYGGATYSKPFHIFLAEDLSEAQYHRDGSELDMVVQEISFETAFAAAETGTIVHAPSVVALLRAHAARSGSNVG